ncbi:hypothetical protein BC943DRAFT_334155 [Umbelopsis sp. AD052]|nr:hypothetical protein BC943DRAFT_334155 [Umbelopsis sp. AD052]
MCMHNNIFKHLNALKTRLNYASFKLEHGWQDRALTDLEVSWKMHDDKDYDTIPVPATNSRKKSLDNLRRPHTSKRRNSHRRGITQADIIDRRTFVAVAQNKPKLKRWHSMNAIPDNKVKQPRPKGRPRKDEEAKKRHPADELDDMGNKRTKMDEEGSPSSSISSSQVMDVPESVPTNSLDFLSFAIAMSEKKRDAAERITQSQPLPSMAPPYSDDEDMDDEPSGGYEETDGAHSYMDHDSHGKSSQSSDTYDYEDNDELDCPSSPRAEAAEAIMMFVRGGPHR